MLLRGRAIFSAFPQSTKIKTARQNLVKYFFARVRAGRGEGMGAALENIIKKLTASRF